MHGEVYEHFHQNDSMFQTRLVTYCNFELAQCVQISSVLEEQHAMVTWHASQHLTAVRCIPSEIPSWRPFVHSICPFKLP